MQTFSEQLQLTRANLERLELLHQKHPDLFEHASGILVEEDRAQFYIHAWKSPETNWLDFARRYHAGWKRENGTDGWSWRGIIDGVEIVVINAEPRQEPQPLFAEEGKAA